MECEHRCRAEPIEATVYSLEAQGAVNQRFRADATADLTVELEKTSDQQETKHEHSSMDFTVDFSREEVARVSNVFTFHGSIEDVYHKEATMKRWAK